MFSALAAHASECLTQRNNLGVQQEILDAAKAETLREPSLYENGNHRAFTISKDGTDRAVIMGTFHLANARTTYLPPQVHTIFLNADRLIVETDISKVAPDRMIRFRAAVNALMFNEGGAQAALAVDRASDGKIHKIISAMGIHADQLSKVSLLGIESLLSGHYCSDSIQLYNQGGHPLDIILTAWANLLSKEVIGIEPIETYLRLIANPNPSTSSSIISLMVRRDDIRSKILDFQLEQYFSGHIGYVIGAERGYMANFEERDAMLHRSSSFVEVRNVDFVAAIEKTLNRPGQTFVAVGAEHLIGNNGVIALLMQRGWAITPLDF